ncbi:MAG TPA: hypothetical protein VEZ90_17010, partial [Blastocatellia bacterium]|nr:hypothetical protein [Blastocatellia bacterium]
QNHDLLGIRSGDALMWDDKAKPIAGDFVLVASGRVAGGALRPTIFLPMKHPTKMALVNAATQGR